MGWDWTVATVIQWRCHEQSQKYLRGLQRLVRIVTIRLKKHRNAVALVDMLDRFELFLKVYARRLGCWMTCSKSPSLCRQYTSLLMQPVPILIKKSVFLLPVPFKLLFFLPPLSLDDVSTEEKDIVVKRADLKKHLTLMDVEGKPM